MDTSLQAVLKRIEHGTTTEADAQQVCRWVNPPLQHLIVKSYLVLICNAPLARKWLARDLREALADELTRDGE